MSTQLKDNAAPAARAGSVASATRDELTARELKILRMIALGHTNAEIARECDLSLRTIETHRARILHKTGRTTRAQLVRYALEHRLLGP